MTFDQVLVMERMARRWSQESVALEVGVQQGTYGKWEAGKTEPRISQAIMLAAMFEIDLNAVEPRK